jgi:hypothetical protein
MRALSLLAAIVLLSACSTVELGRDFDLSAFDKQVRQGVSTRADVTAWLGAPAGKGTAVESNGERLEQWTYYHGKGRLPGLKDAHFSMLQVKFDAGGIVRSYNWSAD